MIEKQTESDIMQTERAHRYTPASSGSRCTRKYDIRLARQLWLIQIEEMEKNMTNVIIL